jgi:hypothetical protein
MTRIILLIALLAVGYDAYAWQGQYTRAAVDGGISQINRLSSQISNSGSGASPATPPT